MSSKSLKKLHDDTHMADLAAEKCAQAHHEGRFFTLEHPARSLAQYLRSWQRLLGLDGVYIVYYQTCMFQGSRRKKNQMLICNHPVFQRTGPNLLWERNMRSHRAQTFKMEAHNFGG